MLVYSGAYGEWRCLHVWVWSARAARTWGCQLQVFLSDDLFFFNMIDVCSSKSNYLLAIE